MRDHHLSLAVEALTPSASMAASVYSSRSAALRGVHWLPLLGAGLAFGSDVLGSGGRRTPAITPMNGVSSEKELVAAWQSCVFNFPKGTRAQDFSYPSAYFVADSPVATIHSPVLFVRGASIPASIPKDVHTGDGIPGLRMWRFP